MSIVDRTPNYWKIIAENDEEQEFLDSQNDHLLTLDSASYTIEDRYMKIPNTRSEAQIYQLKHDFEQAALNHQKAQQRRGSFKVITE